MQLEVTKEELHLIRYACNELASRRLEQAFDAKHGHARAAEGYVRNAHAEAMDYERIAAKTEACFMQNKPS